MFSRRIPGDLSPSPLSETWARSTIEIDLTETNPTRCVLPYPDTLGAALAEASALFPYAPEPRGEPGARAAILEFERLPQETPLFITASTSESYALLFKLLCNPGEHVAAPRPGYPLVPHLAELEGLAVEPYRIVPDPWRIDLVSLEAALKSGARALVLIQPHNPTGATSSAAEQHAVARLARQYDVPIVADEVFAAYATGACVSYRHSGAPLVFTLNGLSKAALLPQLKLGWLTVTGDPERVASALPGLEWINDAYLSAATPIQRALAQVLRIAPTLQRVARARLLVNRQALESALAGTEARVLDSLGGWCAVVQLLAGVAEEEVVLRLAHEHAVKVHPGYFFDFDEPRYLVLSLLLPEAQFLEGARRLAVAVA